MVLVRAVELAMVPAHGSVDVDAHADALGAGELDEGAGLVGDGTEVALVDRLADGAHGRAVLDDLGPAHQLHAAQLPVPLARLHQHPDAGAALEVLDLLAAPVGPEHRIAVEDGVPHGDEVDRAVVVERRDVHGVAAAEELVDLLGAHADLVAARHGECLLVRRDRDRQGQARKVPGAEPPATSSGATGQSVSAIASDGGRDPLGPHTSSTSERGTSSSSRSHGSTRSASTRPATACHIVAGIRRPAPATAHTGTSRCRATTAAASEPLTATNASGPIATASTSTTLASATAPASPVAGTSCASTSARCSRRTSPAASPAASRASTDTSPRRSRASAVTSGQPITHTVPPSGRAWASSTGVRSASSSSTAAHASACPSGAVRTRAHSHHSGPEVGCRSMTRRQAATSPAGSSRKADRAAAVSRTRSA